jgi:hypothetical protein
MNNRIFQLGLCVAVALFLTAAVAYSQVANVLVGEIPFNFHVGRTVMPAGEYIVKINSSTSGSVIVQNKDRSTAVLVLTNPFIQGRKDAPSKLVFNRYGSEYFLSQVWNKYGTTGRELSKTKAELEMAKNARESNATEVAMGKK